MLSTSTEKQYICPGESHPISRAVHLARLAAYSPACRNCPLREDAVQLPGRTQERWNQIRVRSERATLFATEGVRGVHLNELTRKKADNLAAAFASLLWSRAPLAARKDGSGRGSRPIRPLVVVGHDERPSSPDVMTGVVAGLRRAGCQVVDILNTTRPCLAFAVEHVQAQGGIFVTGSGCDPSWTGLDFFSEGGCPVSACGDDDSQSAAITLEAIESQSSLPFCRPTRHAGTHRTFQALVPYEAGLWKNFHALRPLRVACGCPSPLLRQTLVRIFATLPCRLETVAIPQRKRDLRDVDDPDVRRLSRAVREGRLDLGVLIDDDGQGVAFVDERGELVPAVEVAKLLAGQILPDHPDGIIVLERSSLLLLQTALELRGAVCVDGGGTRASMFRTLQESGAVLGAGGSGRYWFRESVPVCDAVLAIATMLQALSRSDRAFSQVRSAEWGLQTAR